MGASTGAAVGWLFGGGMNIGFRALFWILIGSLVGTAFGLLAGLVNGLVLSIVSPALAETFTDYMQFRRRIAVAASVTTALLIVMILTVFTDLAYHDPVSGSLIGLFLGVLGGLTALYAAHRNAAWFWHTNHPKTSSANNLKAGDTPL